MIKLSSNIKLIGKSLYLIKEKILVIGDLHIGYEEQSRNFGLFVLKEQNEEIKKNLDEIFNKIKNIKKIIILGDLKHEFGKINRQEFKETDEILKMLQKKCKKIILVKGNHDIMSNFLLKNNKIEIADFYIEKEFAFFHGHKIYPGLYEKKIKYWIIGHKHPAVVIRKGGKQETYKCFLIGKYKDRNLIVLPSFFPLTEGSKINNNDNLLGFKVDFNNFSVYVVAENEVLSFGKLKNIKKMK
jgi:hypothetical protein